MTAMQKLLIHFNEKNESGWFSMDEVEQAILDFGIPAEKHWMVNAHIAGQMFASDCDHNDSEEYYNEVYGNKAAPEAK